MKCNRVQAFTAGKQRRRPRHYCRGAQAVRVPPCSSAARIAKAVATAHMKCSSGCVVNCSRSIPPNWNSAPPHDCRESGPCSWRWASTQEPPRWWPSRTVRRGRGRRTRRRPKRTGAAVLRRQRGLYPAPAHRPTAAVTATRAHEHEQTHRAASGTRHPLGGRPVLRQECEPFDLASERAQARALWDELRCHVERLQEIYPFTKALALQFRDRHRSRHKPQDEEPFSLINPLCFGDRTRKTRSTRACCRPAVQPRDPLPCQLWHAVDTEADDPVAGCRTASAMGAAF